VASPPAKAKKPGPDSGSIAEGPKQEPVGEFANGINSLYFTPGEAGTFAIVTGGEKGNWETIHVCKGPPMQKIGTLHLNDAAARAYAVQPDGKQLAMMTSSGVGGTENLKVLAVADGAELKSFKLEAEGNPPRPPRVIAIAFVGQDRLLTVVDTGGFDVHDTAVGKRLFGMAGPLKSPPMELPPGQVPVPELSGFSLAEDGKSMALFDGDGFTIYDPATGKQLGKTDRLKLDGKFALWGTALRPDGSRLAAAIRIGDKLTGTDILRVFDTATGKQLSEAPFKARDTFRARFAWCGPDFLAIGGDTGNQVELWAGADMPKKLTVLPTYLAATHGGKLWQSIYRSSNKESPYLLIRIAPAAP
jgi:WD40 repeat protein